MVWSDLANERQVAAISSGLKNTSVIAGPGTGKTRTLLAKAVQLIEDEAARPDRIRIVNFTNSGVHDLRSKIATESNYFELCSENVSTFHSLALRALSKVSGTAIQRPVIILDDWEEHHLVDQFTKARLGIHDIREAKKIRDDYNARWCMASDDIEDWLSESRRKEFEGIYSTLKALLGLTTRGELTFVWWRYLRNLADPNPSTIGVDADFLLVDEYQDLNECEHDILKILSNNGVSIFAVGDPNQSIYESLRHAHPHYCWEFPDRLGDADLHILEDSYRCPRRVLEMAKALLGTSKGVPAPGKSNKVGEAHILTFTSGKAEVSGI
jgi:superfamily I DNA/RNA helicase